MDPLPSEPVRVVGIGCAVLAMVCFLWSSHLATVHSREFAKVESTLFTVEDDKEFEQADQRLDATARIATRSFWMMVAGIGLLLLSGYIWFWV